MATPKLAGCTQWKEPDFVLDCATRKTSVTEHLIYLIYLQTTGMASKRTTKWRFCPRRDSETSQPEERGYIEQNPSFFSGHSELDRVECTIVFTINRAIFVFAQVGLARQSNGLLGHETHFDVNTEVG